MLGRERVRAVMQGRQPDRCPVQYQFFGGAHRVLDVIGQSMAQAYGSAAGIAGAQVAAAELFGHDTAMVPWGCLTVEAEAFGCELDHHDRWYPQVRTRPLAASTDLDSLPDLGDGFGGRMPMLLDAMGETRTRAGDDLFVIAMVVSPFLVACELRGMSEFMLDIGLRPAFVDELLTVVTGGLCHYVDGIVATGAADAIMFENAGMSGELLGPHHVASIVRPHHRALVAHARRTDPNVVLIEHNCGEQPYFAEIQSTDVDAVSFASSDLMTAVEPAAADRGLVAVGMVDHGELMLKGTPHDVRTAAESCIAVAGDRPFILSTGCEIPFKAPVENIVALAEVAKAH